MVLVKKHGVVKNYRAPLTSERSKVHAYKHELVVVVGKAGYKFKETLRVIHTEPSVNPEDSPCSSGHRPSRNHFTLLEVSESPKIVRSEF